MMLEPCLDSPLGVQALIPQLLCCGGYRCQLLLLGQEVAWLLGFSVSSGPRVVAPGHVDRYKSSPQVWCEDQGQHCPNHFLAQHLPSLGPWLPPLPRATPPALAEMPSWTLSCRCCGSCHSVEDVIFPRPFTEAWHEQVKITRKEASNHGDHVGPENR